MPMVRAEWMIDATEYCCYYYRVRYYYGPPLVAPRPLRHRSRQSLATRHCEAAGARPAGTRRLGSGLPMPRWRRSVRLGLPGAALARERSFDGRGGDGRERAADHDRDHNLEQLWGQEEEEEARGRRAGREWSDLRRAADLRLRLRVRARARGFSRGVRIEADRGSRRC